MKMEVNSNLSLLEKFQEWISSSTSLKLMVIGFVVLILLIPQSMTMDLIQERQLRSEEAEDEISSKWSREQTLTGPYLVIPYHHYREIESGTEKKLIKELRSVYFFPENLNILGDIQAQPLHRGIFDVVVYTGELSLNANFPQLPLKKLGLLPDQILWDQASLMIGVSDLRGIGENPQLIINGTNHSSEPFTDDPNQLRGLQVKLLLDSANQNGLNFEAKLKLKGSKSFQVTPLGKTTQMELKGNWSSPSFQGEFLPETRNMSDQGFESSWKVLHFNRPFGQEFLGSMPIVEHSAFGLSLKLPADQYQQSVRTSKYALLIIILSFLALFLMEIFTKTRIHPLQYILIGFTLVLYYTLLIALSEQIGFSLAYLLASLATVGLLALYSKSLFSQFKNTGIFAGILIAFYIFIFVIVKQQDYALLIGSLGLFIVLAVTMYISRKIDWYKK